MIETRANFITHLRLAPDWKAQSNLLEFYAEKNTLNQLNILFKKIKWLPYQKDVNVEIMFFAF